MIYIFLLFTSKLIFKVNIGILLHHLYAGSLYAEEKQILIMFCELSKTINTFEKMKWNKLSEANCPRNSEMAYFVFFWSITPNCFVYSNAIVCEVFRKCLYFTTTTTTKVIENKTCSILVWGAVLLLFSCFCVAVLFLFSFSFSFCLFVLFYFCLFVLFLFCFVLVCLFCVFCFCFYPGAKL